LGLSASGNEKANRTAGGRKGSFATDIGVKLHPRKKNGGLKQEVPADLRVDSRENRGPKIDPGTGRRKTMEKL